MKSVDKTARTIDEAVEAALAELEASREQVEIEILQEPTRSFLGILGHSEAKVRVSLREVAAAPSPQPAAAEAAPPSPHAGASLPLADASPLARQAQQHLASLVEAMGIPAQVELVRDDEEEVVLDIKGADLGLLIGKHGQTLGAIQLLVALMTNKGQERPRRVVVDAEGYRARREQTLRSMAQNAAHKAKQTGRDVILEDLAPNERRIIHTTLADEPGITTRSIGEDPYRKVIVAAGSPDQRHEHPEDHPE